MNSSFHHISFAESYYKICISVIAFFAAVFPNHAAADNSLADNVTEYALSIALSDKESGNEGLISAYYEHKFTYQTDRMVTEPQWSLKIEQADGKYKTVVQSTDHDFIVPPIESFDGCNISPNGVINSGVSFECVADGKPLSADDYAVRIDLKPIIKAIHNLAVAPRDRYRDLSCDIEYSGADYVTAALEVDQSSSWRTFYIDQPGYAHLSIPGFSLAHDAWLDITVRNEYGTVTETIDLPASFTTGSSAGIPVTDVDFSETIHLFTPGGIYLGEFESKNQLTGNLKPGVYLIRSAGPEECARKIVIH